MLADIANLVGGHEDSAATQVLSKPGVKVALGLQADLDLHLVAWANAFVVIHGEQYVFLLHHSLRPAEPDKTHCSIIPSSTVAPSTRAGVKDFADGHQQAAGERDGGDYQFAVAVSGAAIVMPRWTCFKS